MFDEENEMIPPEMGMGMGPLAPRKPVPTYENPSVTNAEHHEEDLAHVEDFFPEGGPEDEMGGLMGASAPAFSPMGHEMGMPDDEHAVLGNMLAERQMDRRETSEFFQNQNKKLGSMYGLGQ